MGKYGAYHDSIAAWGVDEYNGLVVSALVHNPFNWPYIGVHGGIEVFNWNLILGTDEQIFQTGNLKIYPNPSLEKCNIELPISIDKDYSIEIVDVMGRVVKTQIADPKLNGRSVEIELSELASEIYSIRIIGKNLIYPGRVVKQ